MIHSKHTLSYCSMCQTTILLCAACGNNTCNGGYGQINDVKCSNCPEAYEHDKIRNTNPHEINFAKVEDAYWKQPRIRWK